MTDLLILRADTRWFAVPASQVVEVLRPLPCEPVRGAPAFVSGVVLHRGRPTPVVDAGVLLGGEPLVATRLVGLRLAGDRSVALAVSEARGLAARGELALGDAPPLLSEATAAVVAQLGRLDGQLLGVLELARVLPPEVIDAIGGAT